MPTPLKIRLVFSAQSGNPVHGPFEVPATDEYRDILIGAEVGQSIRLLVEDMNYIGVIDSKTYVRGNPVDGPNNPDTSWRLELFLKAGPR